MIPFARDGTGMLDFSDHRMHRVRGGVESLNRSAEDSCGHRTLVSQALQVLERFTEAG